ncbi:acetone carboxylase subunit gamma [Corynebacterium falsenii]|uniref:Acetone carboxylase subunit gamma n=1 Tax=Corynebacterium falsenii TaxID=108486 RepID=A0A418Q8H4_9CORY|nr:acetone carboxylase subunit gamma [Corynebacterium falsenii]AHI03278.1 acetone carboxylase subunit gamma [Corynebacterium falsenii DSM 44353]MDC7103397.1 acetone carboxylase subunit gamma [Corynebacterium falsenii]RIX35791.1 acetone carboxylase subunit gamma [Corynebacterium falsenii]UBI03971.1 acetone carboxylase subunit gamma [Corynebacterium falsenii]HJF12353.1 acetone carboxylase subunit gamma [Corynebacterium falsenii]
MAYTKEKVRDLVNGKIDDDTYQQMLSSPKDIERFPMYLEILQEQVPWDDKIVLPLGPKLFIVQQPDDKRWVIKSWSGHVFCDWNENWKMHALIRVRETAADMEEIYPRLMAPSTDWQVIREYIDPTSGDLLEVEAPVPWYPVIRDFEPDIDTFYKEWVGIDIPERSN